MNGPWSWSTGPGGCSTRPVGMSWSVAGLPAGGVEIAFDDLLAQSIDPQAVR